MKFIKSRTVVIVVVFALLLAFGAWLRSAGYLDTEALGAMVARLGGWALPAYVGLFIAGTLLQIPGIVFVVAAPLAFGPTLGFAAAYVAAVLAVTASFLMVRLVRRRDAAPIKLPLRWAQRLLDRAERRPVMSVAVLRLMFFLAPPLNVGLGLSTLRTRDYVVGSAVGLLAPLAVVTCGVGLL